MLRRTTSAIRLLTRRVSLAARRTREVLSGRGSAGFERRVDRWIEVLRLLVREPGRVAGMSEHSDLLRALEFSADGLTRRERDALERWPAVEPPDLALVRMLGARMACEHVRYLLPGAFGSVAALRPLLDEAARTVEVCRAALPELRELLDTGTRAQPDAMLALGAFEDASARLRAAAAPLDALRDARLHERLATLQRGGPEQEPSDQELARRLARLARRSPERCLTEWTLALAALRQTIRDARPDEAPPRVALAGARAIYEQVVERHGGDADPGALDALHVGYRLLLGAGEQRAQLAGDLTLLEAVGEARAALAALGRLTGPLRPQGAAPATRTTQPLPPARPSAALTPPPRWAGVATRPPSGPLRKLVQTLTGSWRRAPPPPDDDPPA